MDPLSPSRLNGTFRRGVYWVQTEGLALTFYFGRGLARPSEGGARAGPGRGIPNHVNFQYPVLALAGPRYFGSNLKTDILTEIGTSVKNRSFCPNLDKFDTNFVNLLPFT